MENTRQTTDTGKNKNRETSSNSPDLTRQWAQQSDAIASPTTPRKYASYADAVKGKPCDQTQKSDAIQQAKRIQDSYDRTREPTPSTQALFFKDGPFKFNNIGFYILEKAKDVGTVLSSLQKSDNDSSNPLRRHILEQHPSAKGPGNDEARILEQAREELTSDLTFWQKALKTYNTVTEAFNMIDEHQKYIRELKPSEFATEVESIKKSLVSMEFEEHIVDLIEVDPNKLLEAIQAKIEISILNGKDDKLLLHAKNAIMEDFSSSKLSDFIDDDQQEQLHTLEKYRHDSHMKIEEIEQQVQRTNSLTERADRKNFIKDLGSKVVAVLRKNDADLFKEIVPRREANRFVLLHREEGLGLDFFNPREWEFIDPEQQQDSSQHRDLWTENLSPGHPGPCTPTSILRLLILSHPEIASSEAQLKEEFQKIDQARPKGNTGRVDVWDTDNTVTHLNNMVKEGKLSWNIQEGKKIYFESRIFYDYQDLKAFMDVKDDNGTYLPVHVTLTMYDKKKKNMINHDIILQKHGPGDNDFYLYTAYDCCQPTTSYGLENILELTYVQGKDIDENSWTYKPGEQGVNKAIVPIIE